MHKTKVNGTVKEVFGTAALDQIFADKLGNDRTPKDLDELSTLATYSWLLNEQQRSDLTKATKNLLAGSVSSTPAAQGRGSSAAKAKEAKGSNKSKRAAKAADQHSATMSLFS